MSLDLTNFQSVVLNDGIGQRATCRLHVHGPTLSYKRVPENVRADKRVSMLPVMACRFSNDGFDSVRLFHEIQCLGSPIFVDITDEPMPGSKGVVAVFQTHDRIRVFWPKGRNFPSPVSTSNDRDPADILREIVEKYL